MGHLVVLHMFPHYQTLLIATFNFSNKRKLQILSFSMFTIESKKTRRSITYFEQVFPKFEIKLSNKKDNSCSEKVALKHLLKHLQNKFIRKDQKYFNAKEKFTFCYFQ